ncbi:nitrate reductase [Bacillus sp. DNRA2]|uniref:cytochrome c3 family protein n=1 Tax=Bacillus sp. DNRA2 TaxID=2723053 RepID=UPI00145D17AE|nr:NapC/NirT family cytochrome c [Bacillus sp. DNRA2]NMD72163.1 nitrate reductase [Bacillus sp. DNRA2]
MLKKLLAIDKRLLLVIGLFVGIIASVVTVKTLAYTDSPDFCQSCHIMNNVHDSFVDSTHAELACGDCHLPHDSLVSKYTFKAKSGLGHVYFNSLGEKDIPEVLHPTKSSQEAINHNCVSCHSSTLDNVSHDAKESCTKCHQSVPHGKGFKTEDFYKAPKSGELLENKGGSVDNG